MSNRIYFRTKDGRIIDNYDVSKMIQVVCDQYYDPEDLDTIRACSTICKGICEEIHNPSIEELLKAGHKFTVIKIFREKRPDLSLKEIISVVNEMEKELKQEDQ